MKRMKTKPIVLSLAVAAFAVMTFASYAASQTMSVSDQTVDSGDVLDVISASDIETSGVVEVKNEGEAVFWAAETIRLKPGFKASPGGTGLFLATIDSNFDGVTDVEDAIDSDGDGIPDAFEQMIIGEDANDGVQTLADVGGSSDFDGDGVSDYQEYVNNESPFVASNTLKIVLNDASVRTVQLSDLTLD